MIKFIKDGKKQNHPVRRSIDIYFVLYLTALVILIAGKDNSNQEEVDKPLQTNVEFPFRIKAEKPILVCKIINDSTGQNMMLIDSINYILDYGDVTNIRYEFIVEDTKLNQRISLQDTNHSQLFSFNHDTTNRVVVFRWYPDLYDVNSLQDRTFNIYVNASALYKGSSGGSEHYMQAKTQFSLLIVDERNTVAPSSSYNVVSNSVSDFDSAPIGGPEPYYPVIIQQNEMNLSVDFSLQPQTQSVRGIAGDAWENSIICYGASLTKHLTRPPTIEIHNEPAANGGNIYETNIGENSIKIKGKMPDSGRSTVTISVQRKGDLKEQQISFNLKPIAIKAAEVPNTMFPGIEYTINPNLPNELPEVSAYLKDKEIVRFRSFNNELIKFTPTKDDIGKTLSFERWFNTKLFGQRHPIKVLDFPSPEITEMSMQDKNTIIIKTIAYGINGQHINSIKELRLTGNAKYISINGKTHKNKAKLESREQFRIVPADNSKPFVFEAVAVDQLGKSSNLKSYK